MSDRYLICNAEVEPHDYSPAGRISLAVNVSAALKAPAPNAYADCRYWDNLGANIFLYKIDGSEARKVDLPASSQWHGLYRQDVSDAFGNWLEETIPGKDHEPPTPERRERFWSWDGQAQEVREHQRGVAQATHAASTWTAPVAQQIGVTGVLWLDERLLPPEARHEHFLVPMVDEATLPGITVGHGTVTFDHGNDSYRVSTLAPPPAAQPIDTGGRFFDEGTGFFERPKCFDDATFDAEDLLDLTEKLQAAFGLGLWVWTAFEAVDWSTVEERLGAGESAAPAEVARAGVVLLFDPLVTALVRPGEQNGALLERLLQDLEEAIEDRFERANKVAELDSIEVNFRQALLTFLDNYVGTLWDLLEKTEAFEYSDREFLHEVITNGSGANSELSRIIEALQTVAVGLQDEAAVERLVTELLQQPDVAGLFANQFGTDRDVYKAGFDAGIKGFEDSLSEDTDGASAIRECYAQTLFRALGLHRALNGTGLLGWVQDELVDSDFYARRLGVALDTANGSLGRHAERQPPISFTSPVLKDELRTQCSELFVDFLDELELAMTGPFLPQRQAQPLPITIWSDFDSAEDDFEERFSGVGVLMRFTGENDRWSHLNLVELYGAIGEEDKSYRAETDNPYPLVMPAAIHPLRTIPVDAWRPTHIEYHGLPLVHDSYAAALPDTDDDPVRSDARPFFRYRPCDYLAEGFDYERPPALIYGEQYDLAVFAVTDAGTLPRPLQDNNMPWHPSPAPDLSGLRSDMLQTVWYRRRAIIGVPELGERSDRAALARIDAGSRVSGGERIGNIPAGVRPLSLDRPRVGASRHDGACVDLQLFRRGDGIGLLEIEDGASATVELDDLWRWSGKDETVAVTITVYAPGELLNQTIEVTDAVSAGRSLTLHASEPPARPEPDQFYLGAGRKQVWLQLRVETDNAAVSFADPGQRVEDVEEAADKTLLIAPDSDDWRAPFRQAQQLELVLPRCGYLIVDRWLSNNQLFDRSRGAASPQTFEQFLDLLAFAYQNRAEDAGLSRLLDRLPDPAIDSLLLSLTPLDAAGQAPAEAVGQFKPASARMPIEKLGDAAVALESDFRELFEWIAEIRAGQGANQMEMSDALTLCRKMLEKLDARFIRNLTVSKATPDSVTVSPAGEIGLPEGTVHALRIQALINRTDVGDALHAGFAELAVGRYGNYLAMAGPQLVLEKAAILDTSDDRWAQHVDAAIHCRPVGTSRAFEIVYRPEKSEVWRTRMFSSVEVAAQKWRFLGRPIRNWFDPKSSIDHDRTLTAEPEAGGIFALQRADEVKRFEAEIFYLGDRPDDDSAITDVRLAPDRANDDDEQLITVLRRVDLTDHGANYFRHRATLYSRYRGMLIDTDSQSVTNDDWFSVAVLALPVWQELRAPQLRACLPLTRRSTQTRPDEDHRAADGAGPPLMAILQESPHGIAGLAERLDSDVPLGFSYRLDGSTNRIVDARKEVGGNPHGTLQADSPSTNLSTVTAHVGAIGLTFDEPEAPAPVFASTALCLQPCSILTRKNFSDNFVALQFGRHLAPEWTVTRRLEKSGFTTPAWFSGLGETWKLEVGGQTVVACNRDGEDVVLEVSKNAVDKTQLDEMVEIARLSAPVDDLRIMHRPVDARSAWMRLFASLDHDGARTPVVVASLLWSTEQADPELRVTGSNATLESLLASALTAPLTVRTLYDAYHLPVRRINARDEADYASLHIDDVVVDIDENSGELTFTQAGSDHTLWLTPHGHEHNGPLYSQRRLALLVTERPYGAERDDEWFVSTAIVHGRETQVEINRRLEESDIANGAAGSVDDKQRRSSLSVRVVEFETPAVILARFANDDVAEHFRRFESGHVDLRSAIGVLTDGQPPELRFCVSIRLFGDLKVPADGGWRFGLSVTVPGEDDRKFELTLQGVEKVERVSAIYLAFSGPDQNDSPTGLWITESGARGELTIGGDALETAWWQDIDGFSIAIADHDGDDDGDELWLDLSWMVARADSPEAASNQAALHRLNFDWLLPSSDTLDDEPSPTPTESIEPRALYRAREAQAHLKMITPPLDARRDR